MIKFHGVAQDLSGNALPLATVAIKNHLTGINAPLYEDDGTTPKLNPMTTDSSGRYSCKIAAGLYDITSTSGAYSATETEVTIIDDPSVAYYVNGSGGSLSLGDMVYISGNGIVSKAISTGSMAQASVEAICVETLLTNGSTGRFRLLGPTPGIAGTPGAIGYLGLTGQITEVVPSFGVDTFSTIVGRFSGSNTFNFKPQLPIGL